MSHKSDVSLNILVPHLTRVEGHGNIVVDMKNGVLEKCYLEIVESPRYFESFVRGREWDTMSFITSRICGICGVGHTLTSLKATEAAMGVEVSEQTVLLRKLLVDGSFLQSHILHVYFLVAPDLVGVGSVFPIIETMPEVAQRALRLKKLANDLCDLVGGRTIHPTSTYVGGFTRVPDSNALKAFRKRLEDTGPDIIATVKTIKELALKCAEAGILPMDFKRETEYISLKTDGEYALYDGNICSSDSGELPDSKYREVTNEYLPPHSTSKHTKYNRDSYAVGALARVNNNHDKLSEEALNVVKEFGIDRLPVTNPYLNSVAQVIEVAECYYRCIRWIDELLSKGIKASESVVRPKDIKVQSGTGVGCTEVPRGILFHEYAYNDEGKCESANCIIPTGQNLANIDKDIEAVVPWLIERDYNEEQITHALEMLVRAYDPCISCSVHLLDVKFIY